MMKKRLMMILLSALLLFTAMPCSYAATEAVFETLAYDYFNYSPEEGAINEEYAKTGAIAGVYAQKDGKDVIPGYGWSTNWVVANDAGDGYVAPSEDQKISFQRQTTHIAKYYNLLRVQKLGTKVFRLFKEPITFTGNDAVYEFTIDMALNTSNNYNGLRYYIGDAFYIGFEGTASGNSDYFGTITPLIGVNGLEFKSATALSTGSGYQYCEFVTYTVTLELDADGVDKITLTAQDGEKAKKGSATTYEETKIATVETTAEVSGVCKYIAFESADPAKTANVDFYGFTVKGAVFTSAGLYDVYSVSAIAEETVADAEYSGNSSGVVITSAYTDDSKVTGTGWKSNWLVKGPDDADYRAPEDTDKVLCSRPTNTEGNVIQLSKTPYNTNVYRFLNKPIAFQDTYGKYVFSVDIKNGLGYSNGKSHARFHIGNMISVGYDRAVNADGTSSNTHGILLIDAGGKTFTSSNSIPLGPDNGSATANYYLHFDVEVSLIEDDEDIIKLTVTQRDSYNRTIDSAEPVTVIVSAELDGDVDYVAFGTKADSNARFSFDNVKISGITAAEIDALMSVKVKKGDFKSADGIKLIDTSKIVDSVVYDFELFNYYRTEKTAVVYLAVYYGGKLAGAKAVTTKIPALSGSGNLTVGFPDGLPEGDTSNIAVKAFVWEENTMIPFCESLKMYSQKDRVVIPDIFGAETTEPVVVAFMGDSITHGNPSYTKWIEYYYRIKYPTKDIKFVSKGISGDTASGIKKRFEWDILNGYGTGTPTEACLMIGMNDVRRDYYPDGSYEDKQSAIKTCLDNIEDIIGLCEEHDIKLTLITPTLYDEADYTSQFNYVGVNEGLGKIAEGVIRLANQYNLPYIDFYGYINNFNSALRSNAAFAKEPIFNVRDRVHATPAGTFAAGYLFINQQINDSVIASVAINADTLNADTDSATVTNVAYTGNTLSYTYAPQSLPMYMTEEYILCNDTYGLPITESINREIIKISGLAAGNYQIKFGDAVIGTYTAEQLAEGVNIATVATNPGYIQSKTVYDKVTAKMGKDRLLRDIAYVERKLVGNVDLEDVEACISYLAEHFGNSDDSRYIAYADNKQKQVATVADIIALEAEAKAAAQPNSYVVTITKQ